MKKKQKFTDKVIMRYCFSVFISLIIINVITAQPVNQPESLLSQEILDHYKKFDINTVREVGNIMSTDVMLSLGRTQKLLNTFYKEHPANLKYNNDINLENSIEYQKDPDYRVNPRLDRVLEELKKKQIPHLIKNAPNIFELHYIMGKGLVQAESGGGLFTKNPIRAAYHYLTAFRYRSLKLSPEIWTDKDRLLLLGDNTEQADASRYLTALDNLRKAEQEYIETKQKLYAEEDNNVRILRDPGNNEPMQSRNKQTLKDIETKIEELKNALNNEKQVYEKYETIYNRNSAEYVLELSDIIQSIDGNLRDKENILNAKEYYRTNYNSTYKQYWRLESRKAAVMDLLEMASLLDPGNSKTMLRLGRKYYLDGDRLMAISSFEKALKINATVKDLSNEERLEIFNQLGGLYYSTRRFVDSAYYYQEALKIKEDDSLKFQLAKIHTENTGNYEEAEKILSEILLKIPANTGNPVEEAENLKSTFSSYNLLITVFRKKTVKKDLIEILDKSKNIHDRINQIIHENYDILREQEKSLAEARMNLNRNPDETSMQKYYALEMDYDNQKNILQKLESIRNTMDFRKIYFTMAYEKEIAHNINGAIEAYRLAESHGLDPDHARREINRLERKFQ